MDIQTVTALIDTQGPDITGRVVDMPAGSTHYVSGKDARDFYANHPDTFTLGAAYDTVLERHAAEHADLPAAAEEFTDGSAAAPSIAFAADPDTGLYRIGANNLGVAAGGAKVLDIATTGLSVTGTLSATGKISTSSSAGGRVISAENNTNTNQTQMQVNNTNGRFEAGVLTSGWSYAGSITAGASFQLYANNTAIATVSSSGLAVTGLVDLSNASSGQIKFPATQNASADANTLDDYEEGTWTPTYKTTGTNFDSVTYAIAAGKYTKIGRMVTVVGLLRTSAITVGGATGKVLIGGLPFTSSGNNDDYATAPIGTSSGFAANHPSAGRASAGTTSLELLYRDAPDGATNNLAITDLGTGASANTLSFSCTYHV